MNETLPEQTKKFLDQMSGLPALHRMTPDEIRKVIIANAISERHELADTQDAELQGPHGPLTVRIYRPTNKEKLPVIVFYHGGGFVFNRIADYDPMCGKLAHVTGHAVVSVDYRLAPEHKFPVQIDEALYAAQWVYENAEALGFYADRVAVAGESVGGNLAALVAQQAVKRGTPRIARQILLCPVTDWSGSYASKTTYGAGYFLETALLDYCAGHYFGSDADRANPLASPLLGDVDGLPPALVVTAELDPLRDEGELYARKLAESGVRVSWKRYPGMIHLFYALTDVFDDGHDVYAFIARELGTPD